MCRVKLDGSEAMFTHRPNSVKLGFRQAMPGSAGNVFTTCSGAEAIVFRNPGTAELTVAVPGPGVLRSKGHPKQGRGLHLAIN